MDSVRPARQLPASGRCCGRKPLFYQRSRGTKDPHYFCFRCDREYTPEGAQRANFAWQAVEGGFVPTYPTHEYAQLDPDAPPVREFGGRCG